MSALQLNETDRQLLDGERGEAAALAMRMLVDLVHVDQNVVEWTYWWSMIEWILRDLQESAV